MSEPIVQDTPTISEVKTANQEQETKIRQAMSKAVKEYQATDTVTSETAQEIAKYDPRVVAQSIFNFPPAVRVGKEIIQPTIKVFPPDPVDVQYSQKDISLLKGPDESTAAIPKQFAEVMTRYLSLPFINDGFTDHDGQRWHWQHAVFQTLDRVGEKTSGDKAQFSRPFADIWDANKATTSGGQGIKFALTNMDWLSDDPAYQEELESLVQRADVSIKSQRTNRTQDDTRVTSSIARDTLDFLSKHFTKPQA